MVTLLVEFIREKNALPGAGHQAELAAFASFLVDRNLSHNSFFLDADERR